MIQDDYVSFEQAKALKELGFNEYCPMCYRYMNDTTITLENRVAMEYMRVSEKYLTDAPTLSLVQKWLREEKGLFIAIEIDSFSNVQYKKEIPYWTMNLYKFYPVAGQMMMLDGSGENFETYELALSTGIDKCIELLKERN